MSDGGGRYAAPEVLRANLARRKTIQCSCASDMWSVGAIMFELYTGHRFLNPDNVPPEEVYRQVGAPASRRAVPRRVALPLAAHSRTKPIPPTDDRGRGRARGGAAQRERVRPE